MSRLLDLLQSDFIYKLPLMVKSCDRLPSDPNSPQANQKLSKFTNIEISYTEFTLGTDRSNSNAIKSELPQNDEQVFPQCLVHNVLFEILEKLDDNEHGDHNTELFDQDF
jgi:hypothetical protein